MKGQRAGGPPNEAASVPPILPFYPSRELCFCLPDCTLEHFPRPQHVGGNHYSIISISSSIEAAAAAGAEVAGAAVVASVVAAEPQ